MRNFYGLTLDKDQEAFVAAVLDKSKVIVFCDAAAGTGKSTLAMGAANLLVQDKRNDLDGIVYIVSPYGEGKQGYLPGSITEKSEVYYEPAYQAMIEVGMNPYADVCSGSLTEKKKGDGYVKMMTHTYLRGVNLRNKVIVIGHTGQVDISGRSGFRRYIDHFCGQEKCAVCSLTVNHRGWLSSYADAVEERNGS